MKRPAVHKKKPARTKKKKTRPAISSVTPRTAARLTLAAKADLVASDESLVDDSLLPFPSARGACPHAEEMVSIEKRYCIDRWEASLVELDESGEHAFSPFAVVDGHDVRAISVPGVFPQGYVSGAQAGVACARSGKRLCSPMEWRKACAGPRVLQYGYANVREHGRCNDAGRSPMLAIWGLNGQSAPEDWNPLKMNDERLNQLPGSLARTGSHAACSNEYGVVDMVGNLHEWTSDPQGTFQGGYYLDTKLNGEGCGYATTAHDVGYHDYSTGFRCCADPQ
jgi:sulfatase modifying factor 1